MFSEDTEGKMRQEGGSRAEKAGGGGTPLAESIFAETNKESSDQPRGARNGDSSAWRQD